MLFRSSMRGMLLLLCLGLCGCYPNGEGQVDESKNSYFTVGKERVAERDYKGAIEAFEKALEANPRSALAHFELGVLYDQHSDQKEQDYVSAMFHYQQAIRLRPNDYPADNARERIAFCKSELVKAESLAPIIHNLTRERDKLRDENQLLRKQLEAGQPQGASRTSVQARAPANPTERVTPSNLFPARLTNDLVRTSDPSSGRERITPLPPVAPTGRTHTVKAGETAYSIARQYHVKLELLMSANPTLEAKRLRAGQILNLPST